MREYATSRPRVRYARPRLPFSTPPPSSASAVPPVPLSSRLVFRFSGCLGYDILRIIALHHHAPFNRLCPTPRLLTRPFLVFVLSLRPLLRFVIPRFVYYTTRVSDFVACCSLLMYKRSRILLLMTTIPSVLENPLIRRSISSRLLSLSPIRAIALARPRTRVSLLRLLI